MPLVASTSPNMASAKGLRALAKLLAEVYPIVAFSPSCEGVPVHLRILNPLVSCRAMLAALLCCTTSADLEDDYKANLDMHLEERYTSAELGFARARAAVPVSPPTAAYRVPREVLGMGSKCPFDSDELIFASAQILTPDECRDLRNEALECMAEGLSSEYTMRDTNRDVALHDLTKAKHWLNTGAFARLASFAASCFPSAVPDATALWIHRGLVIQYDAAAGLTHQPIHRDASLISCVVPLNQRSEYEGGGTYIEPLGRSLVLEQGCALFHPSHVRHTGHRITGGVRWVLVLFLNTQTMHYAEHGRRFMQRAARIFRSKQHLREIGGEAPVAGNGQIEEEEYRLWLLALQFTEESDHEIFLNLGSRQHYLLGDPVKAEQLFQRALELNPKDALVLAQLALACLDLGQPLNAFRYLRRALAVDPYDAEVRYHLGELLFQKKRMNGLAKLLEEAPENAMSYEGLQWLAAQLELFKNSRCQDTVSRGPNDFSIESRVGSS